jgi:hypothetical protein
LGSPISKLCSAAPSSIQDGLLLLKIEISSIVQGTILKGTHPRTIPARLSVIWFSGFRGEDLNVIFYQNMPNLHNRYKSAERIYVKLLLAM